MRQGAIPKLSELSSAGRAELLAIWVATLGQPPAALRTSRELLASALAWQLQERKFGGLSAAIKRKLRVLAPSHKRKQRSAKLPPAATNLRPGTVITKQWRGAQHVCWEMAFNTRAQFMAVPYQNLIRANSLVVSSSRR